MGVERALKRIRSLRLVFDQLCTPFFSSPSFELLTLSHANLLNGKSFLIYRKVSLVAMVGDDLVSMSHKVRRISAIKKPRKFLLNLALSSAK